MRTVKTAYGMASFRFGKYPRTSQPSVQLVQSGEVLATLSLNMPEYSDQLGVDEFFAKTYGENEVLARACYASGHFHDTGRRIASGYVDIEIWRIK